MSDAVQSARRCPTRPPRLLLCHALADAERRRAIDAKAAAPRRKSSGRGGLDPARYGDWEVKGTGDGL